MGATHATWTDQTSLDRTAPGAPDHWAVSGNGRTLKVLVVFTNPPCTLEALRYAARLSHAERVSIRLLVPQVVPYPLPLQEPAVRTSILARRLLTIVVQAEVEANVEILLCRDAWDAIHQALATPHLVVIGGPRRWWPTREKRIAKRLRAEGHYVLLTESKRVTYA